MGIGSLLTAMFIVGIAAGNAQAEAAAAELLSAIKAGDRPAIERLLAAHPTLVEARTPSGASFLSMCVYVGRPELADVFLRFGAKLDLFEAAALGKTSVLKELARSPEDVNSYSPDGYTPLALAAFFGHPDAVAFLLAAGADVNAASRNPQRVTALHGAVAGPAPDIAELLLKAGADTNVRQEGDNTPLHAAAARGIEHIVRRLLEHGASAAARNSQGKTPYELAKEKGHGALAERLLR